MTNMSELAKVTYVAEWQNYMTCINLPPAASQRPVYLAQYAQDPLCLDPIRLDQRHEG